MDASNPPPCLSDPDLESGPPLDLDVLLDLKDQVMNELLDCFVLVPHIGLVEQHVCFLPFAELPFGDFLQDVIGLTGIVLSSFLGKRGQDFPLLALGNIIFRRIVQGCGRKSGWRCYEQARETARSAQ